MNYTSRKNSGFTLIELMVVISIIGLLAAIILASLSTAQAKARDAVRLENMHQLEIALNSYANANGSFPFASTLSSTGWEDDNASNAVSGKVAWQNGLNTALVPKFASSLPPTDSRYNVPFAGAGPFLGYVVVGTNWISGGGGTWLLPLTVPPSPCQGHIILVYTMETSSNYRQDCPLAGSPKNAVVEIIQ